MNKENIGGGIVDPFAFSDLKKKGRDSDGRFSCELRDDDLEDLPDDWDDGGDVTFSKGTTSSAPLSMSMLEPELLDDPPWLEVEDRSWRSMPGLGVGDYGKGEPRAMRGGYLSEWGGAGNCALGHRFSDRGIYSQRTASE